MEIKFKEWNCYLEFDKYVSNDRIAIQLREVSTGEYIACATVNLSNESFNEDEVAIKDYSENEGMLETLIDNKVVSEPVRWSHTNYVDIPICHLLKKDESG